MNIKLVSIEQGITALGFRRVAAVARQLNPAADILFIPIGNVYSLASHLFPSLKSEFGQSDVEAVAVYLAGADLVCFSSMTPCAGYVEQIVKALRRLNPKTFILWGGAHCIIDPDSAIQHADVVCIGEGEIAFESFYRAFSCFRDVFTLPGFWFNRNGVVVKNAGVSLNVELDKLPHPFSGFSCRIYDAGRKAFRGFTRRDYLRFNGLSYRAVWSLGCPYSCSYCANDVFVARDGGYRKLRFASVDHILSEIEQAMEIHPYIASVVFYDDNFILLPVETLRKFGVEYKRRIDLPFVVFGLHPNAVTTEKLDILGEAGMNRGRMGIQSGCESTLEFFHRPTSVAVIRHSAKVLAAAARQYGMIPPAYDIISDNPVEKREDVLQTLRVLYSLDRPYTLTLFSLRIFPNTRLWRWFSKHPEMDSRGLQSPYLETKKTAENILFYLLAIGKPPEWLFLLLCQKVRSRREPQPTYPVLFFLIKSLYLLSRALSHLRRCDSTVIVGAWAYYLWKCGLVKSGRPVYAGCSDWHSKNIL